MDEGGLVTRLGKVTLPDDISGVHLATGLGTDSHEELVTRVGVSSSHVGPDDSQSVPQWLGELSEKCGDVQASRTYDRAS